MIIANGSGLRQKGIELERHADGMTSGNEQRNDVERDCGPASASGLRTEELYRSVFDNMTDGFGLHEAVCERSGRMTDYRFLDINPAFETLTGLSREVVIGRRVTEIMASGEPAFWIEKYGSVVATGIPLHFEKYSESLKRHFEVHAYRVSPTRFAVIFRDVTERHLLQARLGAMARFPAENPNPVLRVDSEGVITYANAASGVFLDVWGTAKGLRVPRLWLRRVRKVLQINKLRRWELAAGPRVFSVIAAPVGEHGYVNLYANEITAQKEEERKRKETAAATASARAALDTIQAMWEGIVLIDREGYILSVNPAVTALTDVKAGDVVGRRAEKLLPMMLKGSDLEAVKAALPQIRSGQSPKLPPVAFVRPNGERVLVAPSVSFIRPRQGRGRMTVLTLKDVTDLHEANALLERVFDNTHILIAYLDTDFTFMRVNRAYAEAVGREPGFFVGRNHFELYPNDENERIFSEVVQTGKPFVIHEKAFVYPGDPEGRATYWDWSLSPVFDADGGVDGLIFCLLDVTQRKEAELALEAHRERLRALASEVSLAEERERRRLANELHDQASQTLTLAKFRLQHLGTLLDTDEARRIFEEALELFGEASEQVRSFTFELSPPILYRVGLDAALEWLVERFQRRHGVAATFTSEGDCRHVSETTAVFMFQSVRELLNNAGKHADATCVTVIGEDLDGIIRISVRDDGKGFDPAAVEAESRTRNSFGLFSISERMRHIGGRVEIESAPGQGACVSLSAPR
jgi:PAS domain S-box-containing protein